MSTLLRCLAVILAALSASAWAATTYDATHTYSGSPYSKTQVGGFDTIPPFECQSYATTNAVIYLGSWRFTVTQSQSWPDPGSNGAFGVSCLVSSTAGPGYVTGTTVGLANTCPNGGSNTGSVGQASVCTAAPDCSAGFERVYSTGLCSALCAAGQTRQPNGVCSQDCTSLKGTSLSFGVYDIGTSPGTVPSWAPVSCSGNCEVRFSGVMPSGMDTAVPPHYYAKGSMDYDGFACQGGTASTPSVGSAPTICAAGTCPGTVMDVNTCLPCSVKQTATSVVQSTASATGIVTTTPTTTTLNPDGTVQTVTSSGSGLQGAGATQSTSVVTTVNQDSVSFCMSNPNSPPSCTGDAIQCAIAQEAYALTCDLTNPSTISAAGLNLLPGGTDPLRSSLPRANNPSTTTSFAGVIDYTDGLPGGACPEDQHFTLIGSTVIIPWSQLCTTLTMLGYLMVALTTLSCARILGIWGGSGA